MDNKKEKFLTKPKPCPFCGSHWLEEASNEDRIMEGIITVRITCAACGSSGPSGADTEEALELWNKRGEDYEF